MKNEEKRTLIAVPDPAYPEHKGPWFMIGTPPQTGGTLNELFAQIYLHATNREQARKDATVMASAFDLLAACRTAVDYMFDMDSTNESIVVYRQLVDALEKAGDKVE